jgi:hypothetical protein
MKVLVIGSELPRASHGGPSVSAVHIMLFELMQALGALGHELVFQLIGNLHRPPGALEPDERAALERLESMGIAVLEPCLASSDRREGLPLEEAYPTLALRGTMAQRVREHRPDAILTLWSPEGVAATHGLHDCPKVAYQGDVEFVPMQMRVKDRALFVGNENPIRRELRRVSGWLRLRAFRQAHLRLMQDVDVIANVTARNAEFYRRQGHPRSIYVPNTWTDLGGPAAAGALRSPASTERRTIKIIGHVGHLGRTGSTYGLRYLLTELLPALEREMAPLPYEVHIIGAGDAVPALRPWLSHPRIVLRGFVEELDRELIASDVFLLLNNAGPYRAAFTRHVIAWSMGLCLIVHDNSRQAIPELFHLDNALAGSTPSEIARLVRLAATDQDLNRRVRAGGRRTYERFFTPKAVAEQLAAEMGARSRWSEPAPEVALQGTADA